MRVWASEPDPRMSGGKIDLFARGRGVETRQALRLAGLLGIRGLGWAGRG